MATAKPKQSSASWSMPPASAIKRGKLPYTIMTAGAIIGENQAIRAWEVPGKTNRWYIVNAAKGMYWAARPSDFTKFNISLGTTVVGKPKPSTAIDWNTIDLVNLTHVIPHPVTGVPTRKRLNQQWVRNPDGSYTLTQMTPQQFENVKKMYQDMGVWGPQQEAKSKDPLWWAWVKEEAQNVSQAAVEAAATVMNALLSVIPGKLDATTKNAQVIQAKIRGLPARKQPAYQAEFDSIESTWAASGRKALEAAIALLKKNFPSIAKSSGLGDEGLGVLPVAAIVATVAITGAVSLAAAYTINNYLKLADKELDSRNEQQRVLNQRIDNEGKAAMQTLSDPNASEAAKEEARQTIARISANAQAQQLAISNQKQMSAWDRLVSNMEFGAKIGLPLLLIGGLVLGYLVMRKRGVV